MSWYWIGGIALVVLFGVVSRRGERPASGPPRRDAVPRTEATIDGLIQAGQKIAAIKAYRALHGVDLKTAKDAIDARGRELGK
jgi:ribosomal protein L7/L12